MIRSKTILIVSIIRGSIFALVLCAFRSAAQTSPPPATPATGTAQPVLFDQLLARADILARLKTADQELPTDQWHTNALTGNANVTRLQREFEVGDSLLQELRPKLEKLSTCELLAQLKTFPPGSSASPEGAAYTVYFSGNKEIINLLKK